MSGTEREPYYGREWTDVREEAIQQAGSECHRCGLSRSEHREQYGDDLHVHHITPVREFDQPSEAHSLSNLEPLCAVCHPIVEREGQEA